MIKENDPILRPEFRSVLIDRLGASGVSRLVEFHSCPGQINKEKEKKTVVTKHGITETIK